jgi:hypothetical protein
MSKVWLVKHPTSQYNEDVKVLARKNDLKIYDAKFAGSFSDDVIESKPPKLTVKGSKSKAPKAPKPPEAPAAPDASKEG